MEKKTICLLILLIATLLSANVCWDNGVTLYEGNFIYGFHSTKTDANNLFISWSEFDEGLRKLKLQKTNFEGIPIWQNPITITEGEYSIFDTDIIASSNDCCFISTYDANRSEKKLYKIDASGSILWEKEYDGYYADKLTPLENGGIIHLKIIEEESIDYLCGTYYNDQGIEIWNNLNLIELPIQSNNYNFLIRKFIDNQLFVIMKISENLFYMKFSETGELIYLSDPFPMEGNGYGKYMNNCFYVFFNNYYEDELKMWFFDLDGNSLSGESPNIISNFGDFYYKKFLNGETYFYCVSELYEDEIHLIKCDFEGNILAESEINFTGADYIKSYDQEQDFIAVQWYDEGGYHNNLVKIDEYGASEPITFLPENTVLLRDWNMYYIEDGFTISSIFQSYLHTISTIRKTDSTIEMNTIREINNMLIDPTLVKRDNGVSAYWYGGNSTIMTQQFNENGEPQYEENGSVLIEDAYPFKIFNNVIYSYTIDFDNDFATIDAFNLDGEPLWNSAEQFSLISGYHVNHGISLFYNGYLFYTVTLPETGDDRRLELMYFDENGLIWDNPIVLNNGNIGSTGSCLRIKGNNIFYRIGEEVYYQKLYEDGTFDNNILLADNSDLMFLYGDEDDFFLLTIDGTTVNREFHYFHNSELMWEEPWTVYIGDYSCLKPIFEEDTFYLTGFDYPNQYNIHNFDYEHNFISENSFDYTSYNPILQTSYVYKKSEKFFFFINSMLSNYEHQVSYTVLDENGNQLIPEFAETVMDRVHMECIRDVEFVDDNAYLLIACGYKPMEGEYERNFYMQKIDLSDYVGISDEEMVEPNQIYCINAFPNPFNPVTTISFSIPEASEVELTIFNIKGQKIKKLVKDELIKGNHFVIWNGTDESNKMVSSGIYLYKLRVDDKTEAVKKCLLLK